MDWSSAYDAGYYHLAMSPDVDYDLYGEHITKKQYVEAVAGVIKTLAAEGGVVLHGHANHLFAPKGEDSLNVFVSAATDRRASEWRRRGAPAFRKPRSGSGKRTGTSENTFDNLFDADVLDMDAYDIRLNVDRVLVDTAAELVVGAVKELAPTSGAAEAPAQARGDGHRELARSRRKHLKCGRGNRRARTLLCPPAPLDLPAIVCEAFAVA